MPFDYLRLCIQSRVRVKLFPNIFLVGTLHAFDEHCNLIMDKVTETVKKTNEDGTVSDLTRELDVLYVRGDKVVTVSQV